jgi:TonB family protein
VRRISHGARRAKFSARFRVASRDANAAEQKDEASEEFSPANVPATGAPATAAAAAAPFASIVCETPFQAAKVTDASVPDFPNGARELVLSQASTEVEVSIDEEGRLLDASVYATSGNALLNLSALRAARKSSYSAPISYCQNVRGQYLFTATFRP